MTRKPTKKTIALPKPSKSSGLTKTYYVFIEYHNSGDVLIKLTKVPIKDSADRIFEYLVNHCNFNQDEDSASVVESSEMYQETYKV